MSSFTGMNGVPILVLKLKFSIEFYIFEFENFRHDDNGELVKISQFNDFDTKISVICHLGSKFHLIALKNGDLVLLGYHNTCLVKLQKFNLFSGIVDIETNDRLLRIHSINHVEIYHGVYMLFMSIIMVNRGITI